ncbi:MAG: holin family protein, partial [Alphaproteobacteria bacterium]|nr:holin family protein [Alphaproteobacteria bacterium]
MWESLIAPVCSLIDKLIPDPKAREEAKLRLMQAEGQQALSEIQAQLSAIVAEAQSADPWTSRARPSFLYVVYALILASIPMGIVYAVDHSVAGNITEGFRAWLSSIPEPIIQLFGVGYLGYTGARSFDKVKKIGK